MNSTQWIFNAYSPAVWPLNALSSHINNNIKIVFITFLNWQRCLHALNAASMNCRIKNSRILLHDNSEARNWMRNCSKSRKSTWQFLVHWSKAILFVIPSDYSKMQGPPNFWVQIFRSVNIFLHGNFLFFPLLIIMGEKSELSSERKDGWIIFLRKWHEYLEIYL